jgi:hypothetical protein
MNLEDGGRKNGGKSPVADKTRDNGAEARASGLRYNLYEHISLSLKTVDAIIIICAVLLISLIILGASGIL